MRKTELSALALLLGTCWLMGCSEDTPTASGSNSGASGASGTSGSGGMSGTSAGAGGTGGSQANGGTGGSGGTSGGGGTGATPYDGVIVSYINTFFTVDGEERVPANMDVVSSFSAEVENNGSFDSFGGEYVNGAVIIPGVPETTYYYKWVEEPNEFSSIADSIPRFIVTSERSLSLGEYWLARPDTTRVPSGTQLEFKGTLNRPWNDYISTAPDLSVIRMEDSFLVVSVGARVVGRVDKEGAAFPIPNGGTTIDGFTVDSIHSFFYGEDIKNVNMIEADKGDTTVVIHQVMHKLDELVGPWTESNQWTQGTYTVHEEALFLTDVDMKKENPTLISGDFTMLPVFNVDLDFRASEFSANLPPLSSVDSFSNFFASVSWEPGGTLDTRSSAGNSLYVETWPGYVPPDLNCYPDPNGMCNPNWCPDGCQMYGTYVWPSDLKQSFSMGNAWENDGKYLVSAGFLIKTERSHPVAGTDEMIEFRMTTTKILDTSGPNVLAPEIGFVRNISFNGTPLPLDGMPLSVGESPTISFDPPEFGEAAYYEIQLYTIEDISNSFEVTHTHSILQVVSSLLNRP